jgi:hypothetical protein
MEFMADNKQKEGNTCHPLLLVHFEPIYCYSSGASFCGVPCGLLAVLLTGVARF